MPLSPGAKLGHYEILAPVGAGGMGEVYKARDPRLDRTVAIKVLPEHIARREDLRARFEREARAVASLNHPHICVLYDIGEEQGVQYMVLEYLEGETLEARLQRGALPLDTALQYAMQTSDALDRAHRAGVAHRDIKPGNLMLTRDGVKLLDFGLAKSKAKPGPTEATLVASLTSEGTVLGTPQYMSPELFEGKEADARADVWAFGAVLYEMVAGRKAFEGKNYSSLVGAILSTEPAPIAPGWLERIIRRCLQKDPEDRYQSMRDILLDLRTPSMDADHTPKRSIAPWVIAAVACVIAIILAFLHFSQPTQPFALAASMVPPDKARFGEIAVSPDGKLIAFTAVVEGRRQLYARPIHSVDSRVLSGTDGAELPFWSPDSRSIGFFAQGKLKRIQASGGPARILCNVAIPRGGTWSEQGVILFGDLPIGILRVSANGGAPTVVESVNRTAGEMNKRWPVFLPGGKWFVHSVISSVDGASGIFIGSLEDGKRSLLVADRTSAAITRDSKGSTFLLFVRGNTLTAQVLDPKTSTLHGEAFPVAGPVGVDAYNGRAAFSISGAGLLLYDSSSSVPWQLQWLDRAGQKLSNLGTPGLNFRPAISPDQKAVAYEFGGTLSYDIWVHEIGRDTQRRLTFLRSVERSPIWSPDSQTIVYSNAQRGIMNLYHKNSNGSGEDVTLLESPVSKLATDWSAARNAIVYSEVDNKTLSDIWVLPLDTRKPEPLLRTEFQETGGVFSPDGRFIAYSSDESGRFEVYVQSYPLSGAKWQVSTNGGTSPLWRRDGGELFFLNDTSLMAASVDTSKTFVTAKPVALFALGARVTSGQVSFTATSDGKRFLFSLPVEKSAGAATIVTNALDNRR